MLAGMHAFWQARDEVSAEQGNLLGKDSALVFALAFCFFAWHTPHGLPNGDAAVYAQQVMERDFTSRPVHVGYYFLAALASAFQAVPDRFFNLLSSFFAAGTLAGVYLLAKRELRGDWQLAMAAPLALLGNMLFLENGAHAEIYGAQAFFLVLALLLWLRERSLWAGICFGVAGLVTPSSALFAPLFLLWRRPRRRPLALFGLAAGLMVALPVLPLAREYFYGDRGLLVAAGKGLGPLAILVKEGFEVGSGFLAFLPLLALGVWRSARRPELRTFLVAWLAGWLCTALLAERFRDVPSQLLTWALAGIFAALGSAELIELLRRPGGHFYLAASCAVAALPVGALFWLRGRASSLAPLGGGEILAGIAVLVLAFVLGARRLTLGEPRAAVGALLVAALLAGGSVASLVVQAKNLEIEAYRAEVLALNAQAPDDFLAIGSWERGILLEHYLFRRSYTEHFLNTAWLDGYWGESKKEQATADLGKALTAGREVWLLGPLPQIVVLLEESGYRVEGGGGTIRRALNVERLEEEIPPPKTTAEDTPGEEMRR